MAGVVSGPQRGRRFKVPEGEFLVSYDPEAHDGQGYAEWSHDKTRALRFDSTLEAMALYMSVPSNRPVRLDGKPNRPLVVFSVEVAPDGEEDDDG